MGGKTSTVSNCANLWVCSGHWLPSKTWGCPGEKSRKIFKSFIPEIAASASNFKNLLIFMGNSSFLGGGSPSYGTVLAQVA